MQLNLKTYRPDQQISEPHFFILNKGNNSGKPSNRPFANSFVLSCPCPTMRDQLYWISFSLWKSRSVERHLIGSVIPFIRKKQLLELLHSGISATSENRETFQHTVDRMKRFDLQKQMIETLLKKQQMLLQCQLQSLLNSKP